MDPILTACPPSLILLVLVVTAKLQVMEKEAFVSGAFHCPCWEPLGSVLPMIV